MSQSMAFEPKGPGRVLVGEASSISSDAIPSSHSGPQPGARKRKPYQDDPDVETENLPTRNLENLDDFTPPTADLSVQNLRIVFSNGTTLSSRIEGNATGLDIVPSILNELSKSESSSDRPDARVPSGFPEHYIGLAPLPQFRGFDTVTYLLGKNHHKNTNTSRLKIPNLYLGPDTVENELGLKFLFLIADKCQFLDHCMAQLFKALLPNLPKDFIEDLLSRARAVIVEADKGQPSTNGPSLSETQLNRDVFLGELGHYLESTVKGESRDFRIHRNGKIRLRYLQDALEVPYWELIIDLFEAAVSSKQAFGISQTIMDNAVAGCYQFIKSHSEHIRILYAKGTIKEASPEAILKGIDLRLDVLKQYIQAVDSLRFMDAVISITTDQKQKETEVKEPVPEDGVQVPTFSILFIGLAIAMVPGMIGFAKATQEGETGSTSDADFSIVIRDTIMTILAAALSAVQMLRSPRRGSAYQMAWVFSVLAVSLGITAIIVYPLANKAFSSLCGFFAQFFSIASLAILVLNGPGPTGRETSRKAGMSGAGRTSEEKKNS